MHHDEKNKIGLTVALSIVVGTIIGSGVFMKPGSVLDYSGVLIWRFLLDNWWSVNVSKWFNSSRNWSANPEKWWVVYVFRGDLWKFWGYLSGWMQTIVYGPAIIGTLGLYFSSLMINFSI